MKKIVLNLVIALFTCIVVNAQKAEVFSKDGKAINGYDPVAFFTESKPVVGDKNITYEWNNATWYFENKENLESFKSNPEKYAPQYGGYCAYGTAEGHKAPTQADTWSIVNDKLYFNYNQDVKKMWTKDQNNLITKADKNWKDIKDKD